MSGIGSGRRFLGCIFFCSCTSSVCCFTRSCPSNPRRWIRSFFRVNNLNIALSCVSKSFSKNRGVSNNPKHNPKGFITQVDWTNLSFRQNQPSAYSLSESVGLINPTSPTVFCFSDDLKPFSVHTQAPGLLSANTQFRKNSTVSPNQKHLCR